MLPEPARVWLASHALEEAVSLYGWELSYHKEELPSEQELAMTKLERQKSGQKFGS